jgi:mRNA interferase RelE/StbE
MLISYSKSACKFIAAQNSRDKKRIKSGIEGLTEIPPKGDVTPVRMYSKGTLRLRIGKFRIIYRYEKNENQERTLHILDADSRGDIYK